MVEGLLAESPAEEAGIQPGERIVEIGEGSVGLCERFSCCGLSFGLHLDVTGFCAVGCPHSLFQS